MYTHDDGVQKVQDHERDAKRPPIIGIGASFTRIEAETAEGRRITASVEDNGEVIEHPSDGYDGETAPGGDAQL